MFAILTAGRSMLVARRPVVCLLLGGMTAAVVFQSALSARANCWTRVQGAQCIRVLRNHTVSLPVVLGPGGGNQNDTPTAGGCKAPAPKAGGAGAGGGKTGGGGYGNDAAGGGNKKDEGSVFPGGSGNGVEKPHHTKNPIHLLRGAVVETEIDLHLPGPTFGWAHGRSYDSRLVTTDTNYTGARWHTTAMGPYLHKVVNGGTTRVDVFNDGSSMRSFSFNGSAFGAPKGYNATLELSGTGVNEIYTLTEIDTGNIYRFYGTDDSSIPPVAAKNRGKLLERTNREWKAAGYKGVTLDDATNSYNANGMVDEIILPNLWVVDYTYWGTGEVNKLKSVELSDGVTVQQMVEYTYYGNVSANTALGSTGDLIQVKVSRKDSHGNWIEKYTQYRYHNGTDGASHQLKAVYEGDAIQRINAVGGASYDTPSELLTASDSTTINGASLESYASRRFTYYVDNNTDVVSVTTPWGSENLETKYGGADDDEYFSSDGDGLVKEEYVNAGCASCGGGTGGGVKHSYFYLTTSGSDVGRIVIEDTEASDGGNAYRTVWGLNSQGVALRQAIIADPAGSPTAWCTSTVVDANFNVTERRAPSAHTDFNKSSLMDEFFNPTSTNDAATLNDTTGVVTVFGYTVNLYLSDVKLQQGQNGTPHFLAAYDYGDGSTVPSRLLTGVREYPTATTTRGDGKLRSFAYTFWDTSTKLKIQSQTITEPTIGTSQNGSNTATTHASYFDKVGRLRWTKDGEGYVHYFSYDTNTGALAYQGIDVNPSSMPSTATSISFAAPSSDDGDSGVGGEAGYDSGGIPSRSGSLPTALALDTRWQHDELAREIRHYEPSGALHQTLYENQGANARRLYFPYWDISTSKPLMPIQAVVVNDAGQPVESYTIDPDRADGAISAVNGLLSGTNQSHYLSWTRSTYTKFGQLNWVDRYSNAPTSGDGTRSTDFHTTAYKYDTMGRRQYVIQVVSGTGTTGVEQVTETVYDVLNRPIESKQVVSVSGSGTDNIEGCYSTSGSCSLPATTWLAKTVYDDGAVGDGHVTKTQRRFGGGANDFTSVNYHRTYRGHLRYVRPTWQSGGTETDIGPFTVMDVDWLGRTTATALYDAAPSSGSVLSGSGTLQGYGTGYAAGTATDRRTLSKNFHDDLGRVYQTETYEVAESNGSATNKFVTYDYYDRNSRLVGTARASSGGGREYAYDGAGRRYESRIVYDLESTKYSSGAFQYRDPKPNPSVASLTGGNDLLIELNHTAFNAAGDETESHHFEMNHDDTSSIGITLTSNNDYIRRSIFSWYDAADRVTAVGDYGSGDTTAGAGSWKYATRPTRSGSAPSTSADTVLLTKYAYNADTGRLETVTHPDATQTKTFYDDLGRTRYVAENYTNFDPGTLSTTGDSTDKSKDRVTETQYNGLNRVTALVALDRDGDGTHGDDETTTYLYGDTVNAGFVTSEIYPDTVDSSFDKVTWTYNLDGSVATRTSQKTSSGLNATVLTHVYDERRKLKAQQATTLGVDINGAVLAITYAYDDLGRRWKVTSHTSVTDNPTVDVANQIVYAYDDMGALSKRWENHSGAATTTGGSQSPNVQFTYDTAVTSNVFNNHRRLKKITYPSGRAFHYDYGTAATVDDFLSRLIGVFDDSSGNPGTQLLAYNYNGVDRLMRAESYTLLNYQIGSAGTYGGWDRFGRIKDQYWTVGGTGVDRFKYEYDYAGNPKYRDIDSAIYASNDKDQAWTYDGLERLKTFDKGTLSGTTITGTPASEQDWTLDALGNWSGFVTKTSGTTTLNQSRAHNKVNEIDTSGITASTGDDWYDPTYDAAGNMATGPRPSAPKDVNANGRKFRHTYDAWNRLVKTEESPTSATSWTEIVSYAYNGENQRIIKVDKAPNPDVQYDYYHNHQWQVVEVRKGGSANPFEQWFWHPYYIDAPAIRYYDSNADGIGIVEQYFTHDANLNVTALVDNTGAVIERYEYDPYGMVQFLSASFGSPLTNSIYEQNVTYCGYRRDAETGLYHVRNRYLDPGLGRWVTRDPIGYRAGDNNLYEYAGNTPTSATDSQGLEGEDPQCCGDSEYYPSKECCTHLTFEDYLNYQDWNGYYVEDKVPIWICERPLDVTGGEVLSWFPSIVTPAQLDTEHSYICCDGPNKNCFGRQKEQSKKGDPIPPEPKPTGTCKRVLVCPNVKTNKCDPEYRFADKDYGLVPTDETGNCHSWARRGLNDSKQHTVYRPARPLPPDPPEEEDPL